MRLIDADALYQAIDSKKEKDSYGYAMDMNSTITRRELLEFIKDFPEFYDPTAQQWIPVSERLPKPNELNGDVRRFYLVQNEYGDMMVASFNKSSASECTWWEQIYQYGEELSDIVAWMPLPEPYKGVE